MSRDPHCARRPWIRAALVLLAFVSPSFAESATAAIWKRWELAGGTHAWVLIPDSVQNVASPPVVVFFHGFGSSANAWRPLLGPVAQSAKVILLLPKSRDVTWALGSDDGVVAELLPRLAAERAFDPSRVALAGHSAGGAYAAWLAHARTSRVSAVMSASASFLEIAALADAGNRAPVHLLYGTLDPNFATALPLWRAQWQRLGIPITEELVPGAGHSSGLTADMFQRGFVELATRRYVGASPSCAPDANSACLAAGRLAVRVVSVSAGNKTPLAWTSFSSSGAAVFGSDPVDSNTEGDQKAGVVVVRALEGCAVNGKRWIFAASSGAGAFEVEVVDTHASPGSGARTWKRLRGSGSTRALVDRLAFPCTP